jgi:hypothetical protein
MALNNLRGASYIWHSAVPPGNGYQLAYDEDTDGISTWQNDIWFQQLITSGVTATLIGTDATTGLALYHLQNLAAVYSYVQYTASHDICFMPSATFSHINKSSPGGIQISITDNTGSGGSDNRPLDSTPVYSHAGYPVVAAIVDTAGGHWPIAGGDATALTVASAMSAIFPTGAPSFDSGGMPDPFKILIKLRDEVTAL